MIVDCPPSLGLLTINALPAGDGVARPGAVRVLRARGPRAAPDDDRGGPAPAQSRSSRSWRSSSPWTTARNRLSMQVIDEVHQHFPELVARVRIPRTVRLAEAPSHGMPISVYDPAVASAAQAYGELAQELMRADRRPLADRARGDRLMARTGLGRGLDVLLGQPSGHRSRSDGRAIGTTRSRSSASARTASSRAPTSTRTGIARARGIDQAPWRPATNSGLTGGRRLRAGRRTPARARVAARGQTTIPAVVRDDVTRPARARARREPSARRPQRDRDGARLQAADGDLRPHAGRARRASGEVALIRREHAPHAHRAAAAPGRRD